MLKAEPLFLKGLLHLCLSSFVSSVVSHPPPRQPLQPQLLRFLCWLPNHHLHVFFPAAPCAPNKKPIVHPTVALLSSLFLPVSHIPRKSIFLWSVSPSESLSGPEMMKGITTMPHFPDCLCHVNTARKLPLRMSRAFPFGMPVLEEGLWWLKDTEMVWGLSLCPC